MQQVSQRKTLLSLMVAAVLPVSASQAAVIYEETDQHLIELYGHVAVAGFFSTDSVYGEFNNNDKFIDDTSATMGIRGFSGDFVYQLELDYDRENWKGGTGDMVLAFDKANIGYQITNNHLVEIGLNDTALDDVDGYGDLSYELGVSTPSAGDQANTIKYTYNNQLLQVSGSYSYKAESSSGALYGDVVNGYVGLLDSKASVILGMEYRAGSEGKSKYGEGKLYALGAQYQATPELTLGLNGYWLEQDTAQDKSTVKPEEGYKPGIYQFNQYEQLTDKGLLLSASYMVLPEFELIASTNVEQRQTWDKYDEYWSGNEAQWREWGDKRYWHTVGFVYRPTRQSELGTEFSFGDAAQVAYAQAKIYF